MSYGCVRLETPTVHPGPLSVLEMLSMSSVLLFFVVVVVIVMSLVLWQLIVLNTTPYLQQISSNNHVPCSSCLSVISVSLGRFCAGVGEGKALGNYPEPQIYTYTEVGD